MSYRADVAALLAGAALPLALAPFDLWPLALLAPALLLRVLRYASPRRAMWRGWLFGLGLYGFGVHWIFISLHQFGHAPMAFALLATAVVVGLLALWPMLWAWACVRLSRDGALRALLLAPALWVVLEWLRTQFVAGFPFLFLGYSQTDSPLAGLASWVGVLGLSAMVMVLAGACYLLLCAESTRQRVGALLLLVLPWSVPGWLQDHDGTYALAERWRVRMVQGAEDPDQRWRLPWREAQMAHYRRLSAGDPLPDLIVWPETALPMLRSEVPKFYTERLLKQAPESGYLIGMADGDWTSRRIYNALVGFGAVDGDYHKRRLVPFGEYIPLRPLLRFFRDWVQIPSADFVSGAAEQTLPRMRGLTIGALICYDADFPAEVRWQLPEAALLVVVSNDTWFGGAMAPWQHLQMSRMRALESGRSVVRVTNSGLSALIDAQGRVVTVGPLREPWVHDVEVELRQGATAYSVLGDGPLILWCLLAVAFALQWQRHRGSGLPSSW